jgi:hypothetical protein
MELETHLVRRLLRRGILFHCRQQSTMADLTHAGFVYRYFLYQQANLCSVPQATSPSLRILGLYETDE